MTSSKSVLDRLRAQIEANRKGIEASKAAQLLPVNELMVEALEIQREYIEQLEAHVKGLEEELAGLPQTALVRE